MTNNLMRRIELLEADRDHWRELAETDTLTGLPNRRALERRCEGWFIYCDLNGFKKAQDESPLGHRYGDAVLQEFGEFLDSNTRAPSRVGGDEFVMWCPTQKGAYRIMDLVRAWRSRDGRVGCAAGLGQTIEAADAAMYLSKKAS